MSKLLKKSWLLAKDTFKLFQEHDPVVYAAAIAFFTVFSLPSLLIIIVRLIGSILGEESIRQQLSQQIQSLIGTASAEEVENIIKNRALDDAGALVSIIGVFFLLFSATVIFGFVQKALNSIWDVRPRPERGWLRFIRDRLLSLSIIIILAFLMLVFLIIEAVLGVFRDFLNDFFSDYIVNIIHVANYLASLVIISFIFALIFKFLPDAKIKWKDVAVGALVTGILFDIGKFLIGMLLSKTNIASTYGAAGSLAGILVWVFYSSILVLIGATFTKVYTVHAGRSILPKKHSVKVEVREIER